MNLINGILLRVRMDMGTQASSRQPKPLPDARPPRIAISFLAPGIMKTVFALLLGVQFTTEGAEQIFVANTSAGTIGQYTPLGAVINTALVSGRRASGAPRCRRSARCSVRAARIPRAHGP